MHVLQWFKSHALEVKKQGSQLRECQVTLLFKLIFCYRNMWLMNVYQPNLQFCISFNFDNMIQLTVIQNL